MSSKIFSKIGINGFLSYSIKPMLHRASPCFTHTRCSVLLRCPSSTSSGGSPPSANLALLCSPPHSHRRHLSPGGGRRPAAETADAWLRRLCVQEVTVPRVSSKHTLSYSVAMGRRERDGDKKTECHRGKGATKAPRWEDGQAGQRRSGDLASSGEMLQV